MKGEPYRNLSSIYLCIPDGLKKKHFQFKFSSVFNKKISIIQRTIRFSVHTWIYIYMHIFHYSMTIHFLQFPILKTGQPVSDYEEFVNIVPIPIIFNTFSSFLDTIFLRIYVFHAIALVAILIYFSNLWSVAIDKLSLHIYQNHIIYIKSTPFAHTLQAYTLYAHIVYI